MQNTRKSQLQTGEFPLAHVVSEFEFQLRYYVHFQIDTLREGMNPIIPSH